MKVGENPKMPYPQCGRSIKTYASGNNDAPSITKYGSPVRLDAQIVALRPHCAKGAPLVELSPQISPVFSMQFEGDLLHTFHFFQKRRSKSARLLQDFNPLPPPRITKKWLVIKLYWLIPMWSPDLCTVPTLQCFLISEIASAAIQLLPLS